MPNPLHALIAAGQLPTVSHAPATTHDPDAVNATQALIERLEAQLTPPGPTQDPDWYGWIGFPVAGFIANLLTARQFYPERSARFLDVGSGIGTKLILAHELGWVTGGVERWAAYAEVSRRLAPFAHVFSTDAQQFDCYHHYDLVYYYGLAPDQVIDAQIKRHITDRMKPGALFFSGRRPHPDWLEHREALIWRKP
jgi:SAM-dependent methyltransferase